MVPIKYNVRNLVVRRTTTLAAAFGLALVVLVIAGAQMAVNGRWLSCWLRSMARQPHCSA